MSNTPPTDQPKAEEVPLEDIDKLLEAEDPEFTKSLEEVRAVEVDKNVVIEASVEAGDDMGADAQGAAEEKPETRAGKIKAWIRQKKSNFKAALRVRLANFKKDALVWVKTKPKEYALFAFAMLRLGLKKAAVPVRAYQEASKLQKLTLLLLAAMTAGALWVLRSNVRGIWIPAINEPLLGTFEDFADSVETYDPKDGGESFYSAFPQERHEFLFGKMKVNLKRTSENPNPMGAFELVVQVDSKDTAIELKDREVEFSDHLQRVFEDETFNDLEMEVGKAKLKAKLKRELNQKLTQGWVKDIDFKTFILKP
jgi:flagellar basal body-associated protein FliL